MPPTNDTPRMVGSLIYMSDEEPGHTRLRWGRGFTYRDCDGNTINDPAERERLEALTIPPAWTDVWICPHPDGHILATGRDDAGRKQYIYHPQWQEERQQAKFDQLAAFGRLLPHIRQQTDAALRRRALTREKVLAVAVRLLEQTLIRIGNPEYTRRNESYGLTTLQDEHVAITSRRISFEFTGKSGKTQQIDLTDRRLARVVQACRDVPGHDLFQYYDEAGVRHAIGSGDVNEYLRELTGGAFTSKHFRTWGASVCMVEVLVDMPPAEDDRAAEQQVVDGVKQVAERLGNTPAVARNYYIHPAVGETHVRGDLRKVLARQAEAADEFALSRYEAALLALIEG
jgi:DNA topoisomerase-1